MKTSLIFLIIIFSSCSLWGENTRLPFSKLQKGDWFTIQCIQHLSSPLHAVPLSEVENVMKTVLRGEVTEKNGRKVQIAFYLEQVYLNQEQNSPTSHCAGNFQHYFDSYYYKNNLPYEKPLLTVEVPLHKRNKITRTFSDSSYIFEYEIIPTGIKVPSNHMQAWRSASLDIARLADRVLLPFLSGGAPDRPEYDYRLTEASFPLQPNLHLTYIPCFPLSAEDAELSLGNHTYPLVFHSDSSYTLDIHLSRPARGWIGVSPIQLMPGDSLIIRQIGADCFTYQGRGAADCFFYQALYKHYNFFFNYPILWRLPTCEELTATLERGKNIYKQLFSRYGEAMHPYWKESAIRSLQYWEITTHLRAYWLARHHSSITPAQAEQYDIAWEQAPYSVLKPFTDYLYQPFQFDAFFDAYFQYKAQQLNAENLTNKSYWGSNPDTYYLQKQIFSRYPQIHCLAKNLRNRMEEEELSEIRREYEDFLSLCKNPKIADEIRQLWQQYQKIEPGTNIKEVGLEITKLLPLKKKAKGYILLSESTLFGDPQDFTTNFQIDRILTELNIKDKTTLCFYRPDSRRQFLPDSLKEKGLYTFIPDRVIKADESKMQLSPWAMILMRDDGTILSRAINKTDTGIGHLKTVLQEAMQQPKHEKKFTKTEVYSFLLGFTGLFILTFTLVFVRFKRMRLIRRLTELKLKAIRSQMNPHFIFNALGSIQSLILQGKNETANRYLTDFSKLLRTVLTNSEKQLIPLSDEINLLQLYLKIEQLRTPFEFEISIDPSVDSDQEEIPGMLLQPIVENAVIHGIVPQGSGKIDILFYKKDHLLYAEIFDNGIGFEHSATPVSQEKHFGIRSIEERLQLLNATYHAQIGIRIQDRQKEEKTPGCRVIISIPV